MSSVHRSSPDVIDDAERRRIHWLALLLLLALLALAGWYFGLFRAAPAVVSMVMSR